MGISPNAGLSQAAALAGSADPDTRTFAVELLEDIGTAEALSYIKTLAGDSERNNAEFAQAILAREQQQPGYKKVPPHPVQFKSVPFATTSK